MKLREKKWKKIKQIHLQIHLYLSNQKPQCAENGIKWFLGQYYTILTADLQVVRRLRAGYHSLQLCPDSGVHDQQNK